MAENHRQYNGRVPYDAVKALTFNRRACELDAERCADGLYLACGNDPNACLTRCEAGGAEDCYWMSVLFRFGRGMILKDPDKARAHLKRACELSPDLVAGCAGLASDAPPAEKP
jgi:TPR repeat protein